MARPNEARKVTAKSLRQRAGKKKQAFESPPLRDSLREWLEDSLRALPGLQVRRMFGAAGIFSDNTMLGILADARVYLKTDDATRAAFLEQGMGPLLATKDLLLTSYYEVPPQVLADEAALERWSRQALEVARAARQKGKAAKRSSPEQMMKAPAPKPRPRVKGAP